MTYYNFLLNNLPLVSDVRGIIKKYYHEIFPRPGGSMCHEISYDYAFSRFDNKQKALKNLHNKLVTGDIVHLSSYDKMIYTGKELIYLGGADYNLFTELKIKDYFSYFCMPINYWNSNIFYYNIYETDECEKNVAYDSNKQLVYTTFIYNHMKIKVVLDYEIDNTKIIKRAQNVLLYYIKNNNKYHTCLSGNWDYDGYNNEKIDYLFVVKVDESYQIKD